MKTFKLIKGLSAISKSLKLKEFVLHFFIAPLFHQYFLAVS
jgi:hypothetical protein